LNFLTFIIKNVDLILKRNIYRGSAEGKKLKESILEEVNTQYNNIVSIQKISGCGAASIAGFAHTTAFTGLMTLAGISGPAGWAIGTGVAAVWLGASAAAGCL
jgi:NAD/NADP transhydrogenase alpha subunit